MAATHLVDLLLVNILHRVHTLFHLRNLLLLLVDLVSVHILILYTFVSLRLSVVWFAIWSLCIIIIASTLAIASVLLLHGLDLIELRLLAILLLIVCTVQHILLASMFLIALLLRTLVHDELQYLELIILHSANARHLLLVDVLNWFEHAAVVTLLGLAWLVDNFVRLLHNF